MLDKLFPFIIENYRVLEIEGHRIFTYENNYFDTEDLLFYHEHHNGYLNRIKVRSRKYLETGSCFFEIKKKEKIDRTNKIREKTNELISAPNHEMIQKILGMSRKELKGIHKVLSNHFNRITFVNKAETERMTLDFNISFADNQQLLSFVQAGWRVDYLGYTNFGQQTLPTRIRVQKPPLRLDLIRLNWTLPSTEPLTE
jgi:hypothetical protein